MHIKEKSIDILLIIAIMFAGLLFLSYFKIKHSMTFVNLDELLWMYRSRFFIDGVLQFNFSNLIQSSQPGVMVMWLTGPFMKIIDYDFHFIKNFAESFEAQGLPYNIINDNSQNRQLYLNYKEISFLFNIPFVAIAAFFIFAVYYLMKKLAFAKWATAFSLLLISTTPYYVYFTTPTDKLVGIFSTLSILSLLVYASKKGGKKFLFFSAVLCSWAALTKLSAFFLVPFSLFVLAVYKINFSEFNFLVSTVFYNKLPRNCHSKPTCHPELISGSVHGIDLAEFKFSKQARGKMGRACDCTGRIPKQVRNDNTKNTIKDYLCWFIVFSLTSVIFLPTIITNFDSVWEFFAKENLQRSIAQSSDVLLFLKIAAAYLSDSSILSFNLFIIIVFAAFFFLIIQRIKGRMKTEKETIILFSCTFLFFVFIVFFSKTYSFRFLVPVLIIFQILAGIGIYEFSRILAEKIKVLKRGEIYWWALAFILISQGLLIYYSEVVKIENYPVF